MLVTCSIHIYTAVGGEHFLDDVIVVLLLEDAVLASLRCGIGVVAALHYHTGAEVFVCEDTQSDDYAFKQRFLFIYATCIQSYSVTWFEQ